MLWTTSGGPAEVAIMRTPLSCEGEITFQSLTQCLANRFAKSTSEGPGCDTEQRQMFSVLLDFHKGEELSRTDDRRRGEG
jgi:hypothetical protein